MTLGMLGEHPKYTSKLSQNSLTPSQNFVQTLLSQTLYYHIPASAVSVINIPFLLPGDNYCLLMGLTVYKNQELTA